MSETMTEKILRCLGNIMTTAIGIVSGMVNYLTQVGVKAPETKTELGQLLFSALLASLGVVAKDAKTGSKPGVKE